MNYLIITKRGIFVICFVVVLAVSVITATSSKTISVSAQTSTERLPIYCVDTNEKKIAITFDAAWGADDIEEILNILNEYNAKATFFVVGEWAQTYPEQLKSIYNSGHEIGNHSYNHNLYSKLTAEDIKADIEKSNDEIEKIIGVRPKLFRFPSGDFNSEAVKVVRECGLQPIQWNCDSLDWQGLEKEEIVKRVTSGADNGSIVLFHNDVKNTPEAIREVLNNLSKKNYEFVTVSELIFDEPYRIDETGRQIKELTKA